MNYELTVQIGNKPQTVFLQRGFFAGSEPTAHLHEHTYTEVHIVDAACRFNVGGKEYDIRPGELFAIPGHTLHACLFCEKGARHTAFQIKIPISGFISGRVPMKVLDCFFSQIKESEASGDFSKIAAYLSLLCVDFFPSGERSGVQITDYALIIHEFFSTCYFFDVTIADLAAELHLSEKQTDRLVEKYTGHTFRKELIARRMSVARHLAATTDMSLTDIARYVGYRSYSGFWKEYRKSETDEK